MYKYLANWDVLGPIEQDILTGVLSHDSDNKIRRKRVIGQAPNAPWIHAKIDTRRRCRTWLQYYFHSYGIISRNCFNCWKTVCRPENLDQLFMMEELQKEMVEMYDWPCKCGLERRPYGTYKGLYAAFWYNPIDGGLVEARRRTKVVEKMVHERIGPLKVILKRACTEMEEKHGPSDLWVYPLSQHEYEDLLDSLFDIPTEQIVHLDPQRLHTHKVWIEWAFERGDPCAKNYVQNFPEDFGVTPTRDYYGDEPNIASGNVKLGKIGEEECLKSTGKLVTL